MGVSAGISDDKPDAGGVTLSTANVCCHMSKRFWWRPVGDSKIEALEMKASTGTPDAGVPPRPLRFQVAWVGEDGRRKVIGHMDEDGRYEPERWKDRPNGYHADPEVVELLQELSGLIVTSQVMDS